MKLWEPKRKCPKAVPPHLQIHVVWSWTHKCSVKSYVTRPSTKCYLNEFLFMRVLNHVKIEYINACERSECHGLPVLCQAFLQELVLKNNPSDHETWSIRCHVWVHVDVTSILHSLTYSVGPSSIVWSELGPAPPFPLMRVLEVQWYQPKVVAHMWFYN